ncbi:MAG: hypothetical protein K8R60_23325 [Burkholderiales bacterium]|nr:hypothetical protein [Burkholderiales bacterium]
MEPFTSEEETALYEKLDRLSVSELEAYIGSAKNSLGNRALNATWRPRIELALKRAEIVHIREEAAAALLAAEPPVAVVVPAPKAKKTTKSAKAKAAAAETAETAEVAETADAAEAADAADEAEEE